MQWTKRLSISIAVLRQYIHAIIIVAHPVLLISFHHLPLNLDHPIVHASAKPGARPVIQQQPPVSPPSHCWTQGHHTTCRTLRSRWPVNMEFRDQGRECQDPGLPSAHPWPMLDADLGGQRLGEGCRHALCTHPFNCMPPRLGDFHHVSWRSDFLLSFLTCLMTTKDNILANNQLERLQLCSKKKKRLYACEVLNILIYLTELIFQRSKGFSALKIGKNIID